MARVLRSSKQVKNLHGRDRSGDFREIMDSEGKGCLELLLINSFNTFLGYLAFHRFDPPIQYGIKQPGNELLY